MTKNLSGKVRFEGSLTDSNAYGEALRRASAYAEARNWRWKRISDSFCDGVEIKFHPRNPPIRLMFDSRFRTRGEAATGGVDARTHLELLQLFDLLEPYFRLLVVEDRHDARAMMDDEGITPATMLRFCQALDAPHVRRLAVPGARRNRRPA